MKKVLFLISAFVILSGVQQSESFIVFDNFESSITLQVNLRAQIIDKNNKIKDYTASLQVPGKNYKCLDLAKEKFKFKLDDIKSIEIVGLEIILPSSKAIINFKKINSSDVSPVKFGEIVTLKEEKGQITWSTRDMLVAYASKN